MLYQNHRGQSTQAPAFTVLALNPLLPISTGLIETMTLLQSDCTNKNFQETNKSRRRIDSEEIQKGSRLETHEAVDL